MADITHGYECGNCDGFHEDEEDALRCCPRDVYPAFQCDECGCTWSSIKGAEQCCPDFVPNEHSDDCAA